MSYQTSKPMEASNARNQEMKGTASSAIFAVLSYVSFLVILLWFVAFLIPKTFLPDFMSLVPTLDSAPRTSWDHAVMIDLALLSLFGLCHSLFARPAVKKWMNLPKRYERTFYMVQTNLCVVLLMLFWHNFDAPWIWDVTSNERAASFLTGFYLFGVLFLVTATFAHDHFHLFGLTQGTGVDLNKAVGLAPTPPSNEGGPSSSTHLIANKTFSKSPETTTSVTLSTRWHYRIMAHPIMLGWFIMFWSTPLMTMPHFLFSLGCTMYIFIAVIHFEEPDLIKLHGAEYEKYLDTVPRFIPFTKL